MSHASIARRKANASTKAAKLIQTVDYVVAGDVLIVASATTVGKLYQVTSTECSCEAGRNALPCWHAEARLQVMHPRKPQTDEQYKTTLELCDELF